MTLTMRENKGGGDMKLEQKSGSGSGEVAPRHQRAKFAAVAAGALTLLASPEQIYINGAPIPSAFTI